MKSTESHVAPKRDNPLPVKSTAFQVGALYGTTRYGKVIVNELNAIGPVAVMLVLAI